LGRGRKIIVLEPRRLAARAAASRMASTLGESVGDTVGFRVRLQSKVSARTRIEVVTEGVFTRMILDDPGLDGVAAVLFDEFHERSLDADLGLAFARDVQGLLRDDLRLLVMSATLDGARVSALLGDAPVVESQGRMFPVDTRYLGRDDRLRLEERVGRAVERALAEETGSLLVFLPGQGEIRRARAAGRAPAPSRRRSGAALWRAWSPALRIAPSQPAAPGRRKVVLATSIAETSLTIEGVRVVIDCGLARVPRYDPASGITRLDTIRVSRAAADQRRGRAGRTEPGVCYRLWDEPETRACPPSPGPRFWRPTCRAWRWTWPAGARATPRAWLPRSAAAAAYAEARTLLQRLQALDGQGDLTAHGKALADMPLPPRMAHMVVRAAASGQAERGAEVAALLTEQGWAVATSICAVGSRASAATARHGPRTPRPWPIAGRGRRASRSGATPLDEGLMLAEAYPERVARARGKPGEFQLAGGRGVYMEPTDPLARETWLAVGELGGGDSRDRILLAAAVDEVALREAFADRLTAEDRLEPSPGGKVRAKRLLRLGKLVVEERLIDKPDPALIAKALLDQVRSEGLSALRLGEGVQGLRDRVAFLRALDGAAWPDLSDAALLERLDEWLEPLLHGRSSLSALDEGPGRRDPVADPVGRCSRRSTRPCRPGSRPRPAPPWPSTTPPRPARASTSGCRSCSA
jgi:ATP-dependent helicase HrpB